MHGRFCRYVLRRITYPAVVSSACVVTTDVALSSTVPAAVSDPAAVTSPAPSSVTSPAEVRAPEEVNDAVNSATLYESETSEAAAVTVIVGGDFGNPGLRAP